MSETIRTHPHLVRNWQTYQKIADFEDGSVDRVAGYLWRYGFENQQTGAAYAHYASRVERLHNDNFVEQYLRLHIGHMSQPITFTGIDTNERLERIAGDVTGYGMSALLAAQERLRLRLRDGRVGTLIDSPAKTEPSKSQAQAEREQSYQVIYEATQILDWQRFTSGRRRGQLRSVVLQAEPIHENGVTFAAFRRYEQPEAPGTRYRWQLLKATTPVLSTDLATMKEFVCEVHAGQEGDGGVEGVPFVLWGDGPKDSFVRTLTDQNCSHMNMVSVYDNVLWYTAMQRNAFVGVSEEELRSWSESVGLRFENPDAKIWTIEGFDPVGLANAIARKERHIHRHGKFQYNQLADDTRQVQSADSKSQDLAVQKDIYDKTLNAQQSIEREIWQWHARYEKADPTKISVAIARDYGFDDPAAQEAEHAATWNEARELKALSIQKQLLKARVNKIELFPPDGQEKDEYRKELLAEIDALQAPVERTSAALNGLGDRLFGVNRGENQEA